MTAVRLVGAVAGDEMHEVLRRGGADGHERAEIHQQTAVAIDQDHAPVRVAERKTERMRGAEPHGAVGVSNSVRAARSRTSRRRTSRPTAQCLCRSTLRASARRHSSRFIMASRAFLQRRPQRHAPRDLVEVVVLVDQADAPSRCAASRTPGRPGSARGRPAARTSAARRNHARACSRPSARALKNPPWDSGSGVRRSPHSIRCRTRNARNSSAPPPRS